MQTVIKSYKYKLYDSKRNKYLDEAIDIACEVWNFCIDMQRMYYLVYGKYIPKYTLQNYIVKLKRRKKWAHWNNLGSQAVQDAIFRVDHAYQLFFNHIKKNLPGKCSPPNKKDNVKFYTSFTLTQAGYKFINDNTVIIMKRKYHYFANRPLEGKVKTVTIKRTKTNEYYMIVVTKQECNDILPRAGKVCGIDYGMKEHFLTFDDGAYIDSPQWYKKSREELKVAQQALSRCKKHSNNHERARLKVAKLQEHIANQRRDWFFKIANQIVSEYSQICIENLDLYGQRIRKEDLEKAKEQFGEDSEQYRKLKKIKKPNNSKANDLSYGEFITILEYVASNTGAEVIRIGRFEPSSQKCHVCGYINKNITEEDRDWVCPSCGTALDRDINAAINIRELGMSKYRKAA